MARLGRIRLAVIGWAVLSLVLAACGNAPALHGTAEATGQATGTAIALGSPPATVVAATPANPSTPVASPAAPATPATPEETMYTLTYADNGKTLTLPVGTMVLVKLGEDRSWTVEIDNPAVFRAVPTFVAMTGTQGLFTLAQAGQATVTANGKALCPTPGAACPANVLHFSVTVIAK